jgi:hypothetical protein
MNPDDVVDRTILNQRYRSRPGLLAIAGWGLFWMAAAAVVETHTPYRWRVGIFPATFLLIIVSWVPLMVFLGRQPVRRLRLGDDLRAAGRRLEPADIRAIRIAHDPDEDFVESKLPVPLCQVTVEGRRGRPIRLVVSVGDAGRLREWAQCKGIEVVDPEGYSAGRVRREPAEGPGDKGCQSDRGVRM